MVAPSVVGKRKGKEGKEICVKVQRGFAQEKQKVSSK